MTEALWKGIALALLAALLSSGAYLGYQWHAAAGARDTAIKERHQAEAQRDQALSDNGALRTSIGNQNAAIAALNTELQVSQAKFDTAISMLAPINAKIKSLAQAISAMPKSVTCSQALSKQRQGIDGLRALREAQ